MSSYKPQSPEADPKLQANPHYWLYKVTREALDDENHPLRDMGHIWNRWACEGLSAEEKRELGLTDNKCPVLSDDEKKDITHWITYWENNNEDRRKSLGIYNGVLSEDDKQKVIDYIRDTEGQKNYQLPFSYVSQFIFSKTIWENKVNFQSFLFTKQAIFSEVEFKQEANFKYAEFIQYANFNDTRFIQCAIFETAKFIKIADFISTTFEQNTIFSYTTFQQNSNFRGTIFTKYANFVKAIFGRDADFFSTKFIQNVDFHQAKFRKNAIFERTTFSQNANFYGIEFEQNANFLCTEFIQNANFNDTTFTQDIDFEHAIFSGNIIRFIKCKFLKPTNKDKEFSFAHAVFYTKVNFSQAEFQHLPDMTGTDFRDGINWDKVLFPPNRRNKPCYKKILPTIRILAKGKRHLLKKIATPSYGKFSRTILNMMSTKYVSKSKILETQILGGLTHKNAEITWHTFQTEMEKAGYHEKAVEYFGYELDAKRFNSDTGIIFKGVLWLYKILSDYGRSIGRPFAWWVGLIIFSAVLHYFLIGNLYWKFAFKGAVPFIGDHTTYYDRMFTDPVAPEACTQTSYYQGDVMHYVNLECHQNKTQKILSSQEEPTKELIPFDNDLELEWFPFWHGVHTFLSLILIFLFGLGVRHRLRLK